MKLSTVNSQLIDGKLDLTLLPAGDVLPYLTAISILVRISGVPLVVSGFEGVEFSRRYPKSEVPDDAKAFFKGNVQTYNSWRKLILDASFVAAESVVDGDLWDGLRRVARICRGNAFSDRLYHVSARVPPGTMPSEVDRELALRIDVDLEGQDSRSFRQGLGAMDALRTDPLVMRTGLLSEVSVGRLPVPSDHEAHYPIPSSLAQFWADSCRQDQNALSFVWRMGVMSGLFTATDLPEPVELFGEERGSRFLRLDPLSFGLLRPSRATYLIYLQRLNHRISMLGGDALPKQVSDVEECWKALRKLARAHPGLSAARVGNLSVISTRAISDGLRPSELDPEWVARKMSELRPQKRKAFASACYAINELCEAYGSDHELLPSRGTGLLRQRIWGRASS